MSRKHKKFTDHGSLAHVRRELRRANLADVVTVQLSLKNFWRPLILWRALKFILANQRRKKTLATMVRAKMGFNWRCSLPKKKQRELGLLPQLKQS